MNKNNTNAQLSVYQSIGIICILAVVLSIGSAILFTVSNNERVAISSAAIKASQSQVSAPVRAARPSKPAALSVTSLEIQQKPSTEPSSRRYAYRTYPWERPVLSVTAIMSDGSKKSVPAQWFHELSDRKTGIPNCKATADCKILLKGSGVNMIKVEYEGKSAEKEYYVSYRPYTTLQDPKQYTDVIPDWAKDNVEAVARLGIMKGYEDGSFGPADNITNGQFATALYRTIQIPYELSYDFRNNSCPDGITTIPQDHYAYRAFCAFIRKGTDISWAERLNEPITRGDAAYLLNEVIGEQYYWSQLHEPGKWGLYKRFTDVKSDSRYARAVGFTGYEKIMGGSSTMFRPNDTLNRAEVATVLLRSLEFVLAEDY